MLTKSFPREEMYSLTDQGRRSSRSTAAQIAEAWAKRQYPRHFASKLSDANGDNNETQHWIEIAGDCGYLDQQIVRDLVGELEQIGKMLGRMIDRAEDFSDPGHRGQVREETTPYHVNADLGEFFHPTEP